MLTSDHKPVSACFQLKVEFFLFFSFSFLSLFIYFFVSFVCLFIIALFLSFVVISFNRCFVVLIIVICIFLFF